MDNENQIEMGVKTDLGEAYVKIDVKEVSNFLAAIVPGFVQDGIGILNDQVKSWRFENQLRIIKSAKDKINASGLPIQQVPLKLLGSIMNYASLEEDSSMQDKWANLLANAVSGNLEITPSYAAILSEMSSIECLILDLIFNEASQEADYQKRRTLQFDAFKIQKKVSIDEEKMDLIVDNCYRLNLLQPPAGHSIKSGPYPYALRTSKMFEFTALGYAFVHACKWQGRKK